MKYKNSELLLFVGGLSLGDLIYKSAVSQHLENRLVIFWIIASTYFIVKELEKLNDKK